MRKLVATLPRMRDADALNACLNGENAPHAGMPPAYDLILKRAADLPAHP